MSFNEILDSFALGRLYPDDIWKIGIEALLEGFDSPALRRFAGSDGCDAATQRVLLHAALEELGVAMPSPEDAGRRAARRIAGAILAGEIAPYDGARRIGSEVYARVRSLVEVYGFIALADEYEDDWRHQKEYANDIVAECREYLQRTDEKRAAGPG